MLSKLYKHEAKFYVKSLWAIYVLIATATLFVSLLSFLKTGTFADQIISQLLQSFFFFLAPVSILANLAVFVIRFYNSMFSEQGYLTFTLPFKPMQHFWCKTIVGIASMILTTVFSVIAIVIFLTSQGFIAEIHAIFIDTLSVLDISIILLIIMSGIIVTLNEIFVFITAMCIGQRYKNKLTGSVISYLLIDFGISIIVFICMFLFFNGEFRFAFESSNSAMSSNFTMQANQIEQITNIAITSGILSIILYSVLLIIQYFVCKNSITKHLNLD